MAVGGWASGRIFDVTGSYQAAFLHGIFWNLVNGVIVIWLLWRLGWPQRKNVAGAHLTAPAAAT
jgi:hypothetical protein